MRTKISVRGIVQGVGFRPFVYRTAVKHGLNGYVRNRGDAGVEILLEGKEEPTEAFLKDLRKDKPSLAQIHDILINKLHGTNQFRNFTIHISSQERTNSGSVIPPDIAICDDCLREFRDSHDRRHDYFFITCTNCGPRYTMIEKLPYDRDNTAMQHFNMCAYCKRQYLDPFDRRFHAQTVACPSCGPKAYLTTSKGEPIENSDPIREAGKLLAEGNILAIKGYGGFHVATAVTRDAPLARLRNVKHRSQKPFAIMARDLETTESFAKVNAVEAELLVSYTRPIVLLTKKASYSLSSLVAPNLHNVGVMLPYTGMHYMLFDRVDEPAFVMTSANPPNEPIVTDNAEALKLLGNTVDYFVFHNRNIAHRCDDSVIRVNDRNQVFIRRSRGYAPAPITLKMKVKKCVLSLGAELNNTICILLGNKAFISQHIGDVENVETRRFLENTVKHLIRLTNSSVEIVACDLHPKFVTTELAYHLSGENDWPIIQVQHHYAHVAGLMAEHNLEESVSICCDGYGYGSDAEAWGGEILLSNRKSFGFKRVAHLEKQPLIGGDLATRFPLRVAAGVLHGEGKVEQWLVQHSRHFPHGKKEVELVIEQLERKHRRIETTSCGRILDAVAAILGICYERTFEGEPAMKLESVATKGKDALKMKPIIKHDILDTTQMLLCIFEQRKKSRRADLAYSAHAYLANGLAAMAIESAKKNDVKVIGFSGGTASNRILTLVMQRAVESAGLEFVTNVNVPPGDGGISFGQAVAIGFSKY